MDNAVSIRPSGLAQVAYGKAAGLAGPAQPGSESRTEAVSFSEVLEKSAADAVETVRAGDATAVAGIVGEASAQDVVEATMAMESVVRISVAVRDKLIEAYQEVMRMPI
ncbi:MAG: hypothetical protein D6688_11025 [Alphaproteobacteria bacterium]|nr:MAG: hypothetical protein D6688_11025 [Alphaproteobacteria bacterium]